MFKTAFTSILIIAIISSMVFYSCADVDQKKSATTAVEMSKDEEIKNVVSKSLISIGRPVIRPSFVEVEKNKKAIQDGFVIYLNVKNKAKLASFRDIRCAVVYLDKTGTETSKETIVINKILKPGDSITVDNTLHHYQQTAYKVLLISAEAVK